MDDDDEDDDSISENFRILKAPPKIVDPDIRILSAKYNQTINQFEPLDSDRSTMASTV